MLERFREHLKIRSASRIIKRWDKAHPGLTEEERTEAFARYVDVAETYEAMRGIRKGIPFEVVKAKHLNS